MSVSPHNLDAERSLLGGLLLNNEQIDHARDLVQARDFLRIAHGTVYASICDLIQRRMVADIVTVTDALRQAGTLEDTGGAAYVASLIDGSTPSINVPYYARIVKEHSIRRDMIAAARRLISAAELTDATAGELLEQAQTELVALGQADAGDLTAGPALSREAMAWLEDVQARSARGRMSGIPTGLPELDALTDGLQPGDLVVVGARPSQGKTALALQLALACDGPVAFFSLEMRKAQLATRALAWLAQVDGWALRRGLLTKPEYERVSKALESLASSGLAIDDASELSVWQIRSKCRRWKAQHGLSMVVIDYLQLVTPSRDARKGLNREQEVAAMSRAFKSLAKDVNVPVVLLAQLNRQVEGRSDSAPKLSDLRESGAVEQDADVVILLHRPGGKSVKDEGEAHLIVAKHRNGPTGAVPVWWQPSQTKFAPMPSYVSGVA